MLVVKDGSFFDIDVIAIVGLVSARILCQRNVVSNLALDANIRNQSMARFRINARRIAGIGIAVGIAIGHVEQEKKIVTMRNRHGCSSQFRVGSFDYATVESLVFS